MKKILALILTITILFAAAPQASADGILVKCKDSPAFMERVATYPDNYYFQEPDVAYGEYLTCGEDDGLPHLVISFRNTIDIAIAFSIFFYIAGFIGWSGRSYLRSISGQKSPEQLELFINFPLAIQSIFKGLVWPVLAIQELASGDLTAKDSEIPVSPR